MIIKLIWTIILSYVSGRLYRMGGSDEFPKWVRRIGCSLCFVALMALYGLFTGIANSIAIVLTTLMLYGCLTTYWKGDAPDVLWYHWLFTGFMYGFAAIPYAWVSGHWFGFWLRCLVLTIFTVAWSEYHTDVEKEEFGRGCAIIATMLLLL